MFHQRLLLTLLLILVLMELLLNTLGFGQIVATSFGDKGALAVAVGDDTHRTLGELRLAFNDANQPFLLRNRDWLFLAHLLVRLLCHLLLLLIEGCSAWV